MWRGKFVSPRMNIDLTSTGYVYLPLLEETGYIPSRRYAGGEEIRKYVNIIAKQWHLEDRAMFQTAGKSCSWDNDHWVCELVEKPKGLAEQTVKIHADYVILGSGGFTYPKIPNVPGMGSFKGKMLHTGRWLYDVTGGSPENPVLDKLRDKRVAIIGTGATAIQAVPELGKYAKELYVIQRTPSAVGYRGNRDTDMEEWKTKIATKKGWQAERMNNLQVFTEQAADLPEENLINDGFCSMPSISGTFGGPSDVKADDMAQQVEYLHKLDDERSNEVRARALEIVKDQKTAEVRNPLILSSMPELTVHAQKLQAWYPGWCKRPTFHDEYLPTFNLPSVHLVDTDGKGLESLTENSIKVNGQEFPVDIIVWSTGYGNPLTESLAGKAEMAVRGRTGQDMEGLNKTMDLKTLHGCITHGFPNLFHTSLSQAGVGVNQVQRLEEQSIHIGYIIAEAERKVGQGQRAIIEPTEDACNKWGDELAAAAHLTAAVLQCTPGYFTLEGDAAHLPPEALGKLARTGLYGQGFLKYARTLDGWRTSGNLDGIQVAAAAA